MTPSAIHAEIGKLMRQVRALRRKLPRAPSVAFKGRTLAEDRAAKRETHRQETARIRDERMGIAQGQCEWGILDTFRNAPCFRSATQMHHLVGGSGRRRQKQSVENVRMLCAFHHREAHRDARQPPEGGRG